MRQVFVVVFVSVFFFRSELLFSQEVAPVAADAAPEVQPSERDQSLKAFQPPERMEAEMAVRFVTVLLFGTLAIVIVMFLLIAYFHEPSAISKPYSPTKVIRAESFKPSRPQREQRSERTNLDDQ